MKVKLDDGIKDFKTLWMEDDVIYMIDQPKLPHEFSIVKLRDFNEVANAISTMIVRGAPAIGATAAFGMAQAAMQKVDLEKAGKKIAASRPTAYDLFYAIDYFKKNYDGSNAFEVGQEYSDMSENQCRLIGEFGAELIEDGMNILTHCNAGALATVDWGTATAPMRVAKEQGKKFHVWVDETRPRCQGARLTAWELFNEDIEHTIIADNTSGSLMLQGKIDLAIVGTDRVAGNGDVANKIGTYEKAVCAKENEVPFYIAAPSTTIHYDLPSGTDIPIEKRSQDEVSGMWGFTEKGEWSRIQIAPKKSKCYNQAFDVTPAKYVTGYITETGVHNKLPNEYP